MSNEQKAHDLTVLFLNKSIDANQFANRTDLEIQLIEDYIRYYKIIFEQLTVE